LGTLVSQGATTLALLLLLAIPMQSHSAAPDVLSEAGRVER